jgi:hypothetical protein
VNHPYLRPYLDKRPMTSGVGLAALGPKSAAPLRTPYIDIDHRTDWAGGTLPIRQFQGHHYHWLQRANQSRLPAGQLSVAGLHTSSVGDAPQAEKGLEPRVRMPCRDRRQGWKRCQGN